MLDESRLLSFISFSPTIFISLSLITAMPLNKPEEKKEASNEGWWGVGGSFYVYYLSYFKRKIVFPHLQMSTGSHGNNLTMEGGGTAFLPPVGTLDSSVRFLSLT